MQAPNLLYQFLSTYLRKKSTRQSIQDKILSTANYK